VYSFEHSTVLSQKQSYFDQPQPCCTLATLMLVVGDSLIIAPNNYSLYTYTVIMLDILPGCNVSNLINPENGRVSVKDTGSHNKILFYSCITGYALIGQQTRTCNESLGWSNEAPVCSRECSNL